MINPVIQHFPPLPQKEIVAIQFVPRGHVEQTFQYYAFMEKRTFYAFLISVKASEPELAKSTKIDEQCGCGISLTIKRQVPGSEKGRHL